MESDSAWTRFYEILESMNPWWRDRRWYRYTRIEQVRDALTSNIRPRLLATVKEWLESIRRPRDRGYGIRIIRGPRRVGKTTLIYLSIIEALENLRPPFDPQALVYITLDDPDLQAVLENVSLKLALERIIMDRLNSSGYVAVFLDEVTFYPKWSLALKRLYDQGVIGPGVLVVATGSYAVELAEAKSALEGRPGRLGRDDVLQRFQYPLRFSEVFESEDIVTARKLYSYEVQGRKLGEKHARLLLLEMMTIKSYSLERVERVLEEITAVSLEPAERILVHRYLRTGGFPGAIVSLRRSGRVEDDHYRRFYELIVSDAAKFGLEPDQVRQVISYLTDTVGAMGQTTLHNIASNVKVPAMKMVGGEGRKKLARSLKPDEARRLLNYITHGTRAYLLFEAVTLQGYDKPPQAEREQPFKLGVLDPLIFYSFLAGYSGLATDIEAQLVDKYIDHLERRDTEAGPLLESVVCSHIARVTLIKHGVDITNYAYVLAGEGELVDCVVWYYDKFRGGYNFVPVEVKLSPPSRAEACGKARALQAALSETRLIVTTLAGSVRAYECKDGAQAIHVPAPILLAII